MNAPAGVPLLFATWSVTSTPGIPLVLLSVPVNVARTTTVNDVSTNVVGGGWVVKGSATCETVIAPVLMGLQPSGVPPVKPETAAQARFGVKKDANHCLKPVDALATVGDVQSACGGEFRRMVPA